MSVPRILSQKKLTPEVFTYRGTPIRLSPNKNYNKNYNKQTSLQPHLLARSNIRIEIPSSVTLDSASGLIVASLTPVDQ